ncbi:MAG: metalloregulator ArsR/SmtB family transcription factor [Alphaproteobacteria bacterium]|nr:metalloregulator ArsR/SmtB family transcription factor [Alphaproteobacteria bacterium]
MVERAQLLAGLHAAAEPTRLRLLALCAAGELTVSELTRILGQSQPRVSRHLKLLTEAGLLERFREGSWTFYRLAADGEGAALAREIVARLTPDTELRRDRDRFAQVKRARARVAADYFRQNAAEWERLRSLHVSETEVEEAMLALGLRGLGKAQRQNLLDIGTGTGRVLELFAPHFDRALGIDLSREMLAIARANLERAGLAHGQVRQADMYQLPLADRAFDLVTIHQVLHYADRPADAIREAARVLKPNGRLLIVDFAPHGEEALRKEHAHRRLGFRNEEIQAWLKSARLKPGLQKTLPGRPLTVVLWRATQPAEAGAQEEKVA